MEEGGGIWIDEIHTPHLVHERVTWLLTPVTLSIPIISLHTDSGVHVHAGCYAHRGHSFSLTNDNDHVTVNYQLAWYTRKSTDRSTDMLVPKLNQRYLTFLS